MYENLLFKIFMTFYLFIWEAHTHAMMSMWRYEDNFMSVGFLFLRDAVLGIELSPPWCSAASAFLW